MHSPTGTTLPRGREHLPDLRTVPPPTGLACQARTRNAQRPFCPLHKKRGAHNYKSPRSGGTAALQKLIAPEAPFPQSIFQNFRELSSRL